MRMRILFSFESRRKRSYGYRIFDNFGRWQSGRKHGAESAILSLSKTWIANSSTNEKRFSTDIRIHSFDPTLDHPPRRRHCSRIGKGRSSQFNCFSHPHDLALRNLGSFGKAFRLYYHTVGRFARLVNASHTHEGKWNKP